MTALNVGLIGCGGFVRHTHLGNLTSNPRVRLYAACDVNLSAAEDIAIASGAAYFTDEADRVLNDPAVDLIFISTPHYTHADLTIRAARVGKNIYCEKPMGLSEDECLAVARVIEETGVKYVAGYNRALAPFTLQAREILADLDAPMLIHHRFADWNPYSTGWLIDESKSGGRVLGEGGHALDMMCRLAGQNPVRVYAEGGNFAEPSPTQASDSALITLGFPSESAGTLMLSSVGSNGFPKEEITITCAHHTIAIYGFERMLVYSPDACKEYTLPASDKGHAALLDRTVDVIVDGAPSPVGISEALRAARVTMAAQKAIRTRALQTLSS